MDDRVQRAAVSHSLSARFRLKAEEMFGNEPINPLSKLIFRLIYNEFSMSMLPSQKRKERSSKLVRNKDKYYPLLNYMGHVKIGQRIYSKK